MFENLSVPIPQRSYGVKSFQELSTNNSAFVRHQSKPVREKTLPSVSFEHFSSLLELSKLKRFNAEAGSEEYLLRPEIPIFNPLKSYQNMIGVMAAQVEDKLEEVKNITLKLELMRDFVDRKMKFSVQEIDASSVQKRVRRKREELNYGFKVSL